MCGRFALAFIASEKFRLEFALDHTPTFPVAYNIAPSQSILAIREIDHQRTLCLNKLTRNVEKEGALPYLCAEVNVRGEEKCC